jgi:uracil permease
MTAGVIAILLGFIGKLEGVLNTLPAAVMGGLTIYLFGVIGMQGIALIQSEKVNLFDPKQLAVGAIILVTGIGGALALANGLYPFIIPVIFPNGIPAIVFAAFCGIVLNFVFILIKPAWFGIDERQNINQ